MKTVNATVRKNAAGKLIGANNGGRHFEGERRIKEVPEAFPNLIISQRRMYLQGRTLVVGS